MRGGNLVFFEEEDAMRGVVVFLDTDGFAMQMRLNWEMAIERERFYFSQSLSRFWPGCDALFASCYCSRSRKRESRLRGCV